MTNPVFETVRTVLAVREFDDKPISDDLLRRIVEAGHLTASSMNLQPWHFVVVTSRESLRELGAMIGTGRYVASAGAAIVVAYERDSEYGVSDASRAIQSMILVAWAEGVGSNWTGFGGLDAVIAEHSLPFHVTTLGARGSVTFRKDRVRNYRDYLEIDKSLAYLSWLYQCNRGVLMAPGAEENWTLSVQHSSEDVRRYVDNFRELARDLKA